MNKLLMVILVLLAPLSAIADKTECIFPNTVKQIPPPNPTTVVAYQWDSGRDKKGGSGYIQTLRILYKNGDHAVIQHTNYCLVYSLKINYFRNRQADDLDAKAIATLIAGLYSQYYAAPEKVTFTKPLAEIIATTFKQQKFDSKKDFTYGLPEEDADYPALSSNYSISYKPQDEYDAGGVYSSVTRFDMGIGAGAD